MKKIIFGLALAMLVTSCVVWSSGGWTNTVTSFKVVKGNGKVAKGAFDIPLDYRELSVASGIRVVLVPTELPALGGSVEGYITADEEALEHVSIVEKDGHVRVSYQPNISLRSRVETVVTMPVGRTLSRLEASSAGKIECGERLAFRSLDVECSSAARIELDVEIEWMMGIEMSSAAHFRGNVAAGELDVELSSAAKCYMEGSAGRCDVEVTSAAHFYGYGLECRKADVEASSTGSIEVTVTEELDAEVSSGASVRYKGAPAVVRREVSSGGSLKQM